MNKEKFMYALDHPETLPERAFCLLPSDKTEVIIIVNSETGYYPYQKYPTAKLAQETVDYGNEMLGVSEEEAEALMILSMRRRK